MEPLQPPCDHCRCVDLVSNQHSCPSSPSPHMLNNYPTLSDVGRSSPAHVGDTFNPRYSSSSRSSWDNSTVYRPPHPIAHPSHDDCPNRPPQHAAMPYGSEIVKRHVLANHHNVDSPSSSSLFLSYLFHDSGHPPSLPPRPSSPQRRQYPSATVPRSLPPVCLSRPVDLLSSDLDHRHCRYDVNRHPEPADHAHYTHVPPSTSVLPRLAG
jgi:hypothetical protein